jgi:glycerol-3-phosphate acyltransferase PlsY
MYDIYHILHVFAYILAAYLIGSLSSAILVCKTMGLPDPRTQGSHNPGATNVLRISGKKAAFITLLGDTLKGFLPVFIARCLEINNEILILIALAAFLGHLYPIFFHFKGGKGVATALGGWLAFSYAAGICWIGTWLIVAILFRYSSLAALTASFMVPIYIAYVTGNTFITVITAIMSLLLIYRHRTNINNLIAGKEHRIGQKQLNSR